LLGLLGVRQTGHLAICYRIDLWEDSLQTSDFIIR